MADSPAAARARMLLTAVPFAVDNDAEAVRIRAEVLSRLYYPPAAMFFAESPRLVAALLAELDAAYTERNVTVRSALEALHSERAVRGAMMGELTAGTCSKGTRRVLTLDAATGAAQMATLREAAAECPDCGGRGEVDAPCRWCGDSTFDHECEDRRVECSKCRWIRDRADAIKRATPVSPDQGEEDSR